MAQKPQCHPELRPKVAVEEPAEDLAEKDLTEEDLTEDQKTEGSQEAMDSEESVGTQPAGDRGQ